MTEQSKPNLMTNKGNGNGQPDKRKAVFLDKDGTLIKDVPYNVDPELIRLLPQTIDGLRLMHEAGYDLVVITNQSGVARGYFEEEDLEDVEQHLRQRLAGHSLSLRGFYYCPHHPDGIVPEYTGPCDCRKPAPGMLLQAMDELGIDPDRSWYIGDILNDVEAGRRAGCRTILMNTGGETEWVLTPDRLPHHITDNLADAGRIIAALSQPIPEVLCAA